MDNVYAQDVVDAWDKLRTLIFLGVGAQPEFKRLEIAIEQMDARILRPPSLEPTVKQSLPVGKPKLIIELRDKTYTINVKMNHHVKAKIVEKHRSTAKLLMDARLRKLMKEDKPAWERLKTVNRIRIVMERHGKHCDDDNLPTAGKYFRDGIADVFGAHRGDKPNSKGHYDDSLPCYKWEYIQCPKIKGSLTTYRVMVYWE